MQPADDTGDARSEARYEWNDTDSLDEQLREERYLGNAESQPGGIEP